MSPVSRGRKNAKSRGSGQRVLRAVPMEPSEPPSPVDPAEDLDPAVFVERLVDAAADLLTTDDPLEAELFGAAFAAAGELAGGEVLEELAEGIIPALARLATPESLAALLAMDAVDSGTKAAEAARRLIDGGVPAPAWTSALSEPLTLGIAQRFGYPDDEASMYFCSFDRAGQSHGFLIHVDHTDCDAAADMVLFPDEMLDGVGPNLQTDGRRSGLTITAEDLDPAEFRWQIERALDARRVHDQELDEPELDDDDDEPGYHPLAALLRARMRVLPEPPRPPGPHGDGDQAAAPRSR